MSLASTESNDRGHAIAGLLSWTACSVGMMVFNKEASRSFPASCTLVGLQMAFTVLALLFLPHLIHIGSVQDALRWSMVVPFFAGSLLTSILALKHAPMTLVITLGAVAPIFSMMVERFFYPTPLKISAFMLISIGLTVVGCGLYTWHMDHSSYTGAEWAVVNHFFAAGNRLLQRYMLSKDQNPVDISKVGCTLLNNLLGMIPMLVVAAIINEFQQVPEIMRHLDSYAAFWITMSCIVGLGISYTSVWVQALITATSFMVLVNANKFFIIFLEVWVMRSKQITGLQTVGAIITVVGGVAFGLARDQVNKEDQNVSEGDASESSPEEDTVELVKDASILK